MSWEKTDEPGVRKHAEIDGKFKIDTTARDPDGKRRRRRKTLQNATMREAVAVRDRLKAEIETPELTQGPRLASFAGRWAREKIDSGDWGKRAQATNLQILEDHILPSIGDVYLDDLTREHVREWTAYIEDKRRTLKDDDGNPYKVPYAHASLRRYWETVTQLCKALYAEGYFDDRFRTWFETYRGPSSDRSGVREDQTLSRQQLDEFLVKARELYPQRYAEILTLARTGMRRGELYGLNWEYVDLAAGFIRIKHSWLAPRDGLEGELKAPKTESSKRTIPMASDLAKVLEAHREKMMRDQHPGFAAGIVFPSDNGTRRRQGVLKTPMQNIADACNIDIRVGPQVMRYTFITLLGNAGARPEMINSITGHSTDQMREHYTRIRPEDQRDTLGRLFA